MRAVVFGGTGFLGSHAVEALRGAGHDVLAPIRRASAAAAVQALGASASTVDFGDDAALIRACEGAQAVVCCVADPRLHQPLAAMREVEVHLTRRLVRAAGRAGARRFVQLSSVQVHGFDRPATRIDESVLGAAEHAFTRVCREREETVRSEAARHGIAYAMIRPANAFGRRDRSFLPPTMAAHRRGLYAFLGDPTTPFSGIDARDVGRVLAWAAEAPAAAGRTFLARGFDATWYDVKETLDRVVGRPSRALVIPRGVARRLAGLAERITPYRVDLPLTRMAVDVTSTPTLYDDAAIRAAGWAPRYSLDDAIYDAVAADEGAKSGP